MKDKCFVMYQFEIGGCEKVFLNVAKSITDSIELITVIPSINSHLLIELPKNVRLLTHKKIPILNISAFLLKLQVTRFLYCILAILVIPLYLKWLNREKKITYVNFSDTLSSLLITFLAAGVNSAISWVHCLPIALTKSKSKTILFSLYRKCKKLVFICNDQMDAFTKINPLPERVLCKVIYNPIDTEYIHKKMVQDIDSSLSYICMVSRLDEFSKDFYTPLKAYQLLPENLKDKYSLVIIGDGPDKDKVKHYIKELGLEDKIFLYGSDINPYRWMYHSKLFLFSSKSEGLGLVILEALAADCYVIATDCPVGPKEILNSKEPCGSIIPVGDEKEMAKEIIDYFCGKIDIKTIKINAKYRLKDFSMQSFKSNLENLFHE